MRTFYPTDWNLRDVPPADVPDLLVYACERSYKRDRRCGVAACCSKGIVLTLVDADKDARFPVPRDWRYEIRHHYFGEDQAWRVLTIDQVKWVLAALIKFAVGPMVPFPKCPIDPAVRFHRYFVDVPALTPAKQKNLDALRADRARISSDLAGNLAPDTRERLEKELLDAVGKIARLDPTGLPPE